MRPTALVRSRLEASGRSTKGPDHDFMAQCPAHDDGRPSLHVSEDGEGNALTYCFAGCEVADIIAALGMELQDLFVPDPDFQPQQQRAQPQEPRRVAEYVYQTAAGDPHIKVIRLEPKSFRQQHWTGTDWKWGLGDTPRVLYHLPEVLDAKAKGEWVFLTEGEKDADAVRMKGFCATTMPGGANKPWEPQYTEALTGAKVIILADADEPGRKHATAVYQALYGKAARVAVRLPAETHKDIADHLAAGLSMNGDLRKAPELEALMLDTGRPARGALTARAFAARPSERGLQVLGPMFQRGMRTVIGAQTGEGKTTLALQAIGAMVSGKPFLDETWRPGAQGLRALIVDLEQGEETLKLRLNESGLADSERVEVLWEPNGISLDGREEDRSMVEDILRDGQYDLVLLDPLYQMHTGSGNDEQVAAATMKVVDEWARKYRCSFVIPMHARKPGSDDKPRRFTKHDIAGSGTWLRNAEFVLGLQLMNAGFSQLYFFKDRMGFGPTINSHWGMSFDRDAGFKRNFAEDRQAAAKKLKALVAREEGASYDELMRVPGVDLDADVGAGALKPFIKRQCIERDGRYFTKPKKQKQAAAQPGQDSLSIDGMT